MQTLNDESMILDMFKEVKSKEIVPLGNFLECKKIHLALTGVLNRKEWIDSSGKNDPPPDFYDNKHKLMMDVMRIDDTTYKNKKGKLVDLTRQKEEKLLKEYLGKNYKNERNDISCFVVASSGLPTNEDHNFERYYKNFERVFKEHEKKLDLYKSNHPGFKTLFFICDESSAYVETFNTEDVSKKRHQGDLTLCRPHIFCIDKKFVKIIKESQVDYVVWYAPWKLLQAAGSGIFPLPKGAIFDVKNLTDKKLVEYNHDMMISAEE